MGRTRRAKLAELILAKDLIGNVMRNHADVIEFGLGSCRKVILAPIPGAIDGGPSESAWTMVSADFVTTTDGTGVVHTAVMYGEDDCRLGMEVGSRHSTQLVWTGLSFLESMRI